LKSLRSKTGEGDRGQHDGTFLFSQKAGREMIKQKSGKIINIVSYAGLIGTDPDYLNAIPTTPARGP